MPHISLVRSVLIPGLVLTLAGPTWVAAQENETTSSGVTFDHLLAGLEEPTRWATFSGDYSGRRHSPLSQITPDNVDRLSAQWTFQTGTTTRGRGFETTPLVVDGVLYVTGSNNFAWALDARTGRPFWQYRRDLPEDLTYGASAPVNRGFGILGDRLFMVTLDAHFLALDRLTGSVLWDVELADYRQGYAATLAPLVIDDKVIVGISGGEYATRGFIDAYHPETGARLWRFHSVPESGEAGSETWPDTDVITRGGGGTSMTGTYDPELDLLYWGTGNPNPDYYGDDRRGDNLYTDSLVAVDAATGQLRWHYQFTPHDTHDWDSNHVPVQADLTWNGEMRRVVMVANRNGFFYVLDRVTGELLQGTPFTDTTWAREIGADGRPVVLNDGSQGCLPDMWGGTNFMPPSFDPAAGLFFLTARETCATFIPQVPEFVPGRSSPGGVVWIDQDQGYGALRAIDVYTGERRWEFRYPTPSMSGVLSTASGLVFAGDHEGNFMAFESETGRNLWHYPTGSRIWGAAAMTHMLDGRQHVLIPSGTTLVAFALPEQPVVKVPLQATAAETGRSALFIGQILPVFSLFSPCSATLDDRLRTNIAPVLEIDGALHRTVGVGEPLTLAAFADDPDDFPGRSDRGGPPENLEEFYSTDGVGSSVVSSVPGLRLSWIVYRGPARKVTFTPEQMKAWMDSRVWGNSPWSPPYILPEPPPENRWMADVTFDEPGEYVLRAVVSDGSTRT